MDGTIGRKVIDVKDVPVKWIYCNKVDYKVNLKYYASCLKKLRAVLMNTCWMMARIVVKHRYKTNKLTPFKHFFT